MQAEGNFEIPESESLSLLGFFFSAAEGLTTVAAPSKNFIF